MKAFIRLLLFLLIISGLSLQVEAQTAPPTNLSGTALKTWLKDNWYTGKCSVLSYTSARQRMYGTIDNKNGWVTCVYTGFREVAGTTLDTINCEHTIPQSFFGSASPMVSDIHHLYPTNQVANSTRNNYRFNEIPDNTTTSWLIGNQTGVNLGCSVTSTIPTTNKDSYSEYTTANPNRFEPREVHKGNLARSIFYFFTMYDLTSYGTFLSSVAEVDTLYKWHLQDPVDANERTRNTAIELAQGNRNPYVDYPELVARAYGFAVACAAPTTQASGIAWTITGPTTATLNFSAGNGTNRLVVVKQGSDISSPTITNGVSYTGNVIFGSGSTVGTGNYVVSSGSSNSISITGLTSGQTYYARVYEYNCTGTSTVYLTSSTGGPFSATTTSCTAPSTQTSNIVSGGSTSATLTLNWTSGNGSNRIVVARQGSAVTATPINGTTYTANATFGSGTAISTGQFVVYSGSASTATITGLTANTAYNFAVYEYNCTSTNSLFNSTLVAGNQYNASTQAVSTGTVADLVISEYVEGSSNNKYLEIYNGTTSSVNLANYQLRMFANGGTTATNSLVLSGTLAPGGTVVYANSSAVTFTGTVISTAVCSFNGNDAIGLYNTVTASYADIFGVIGVDPGATGWIATGYQTTDKTVRRKATACNGIVVNPSGTGSSSFTTLSTDWDVFAIDVVTGLGSHTATCSSTCSAPTQAASTVIVKNPTETTARVRWQRGNGTGGVIVLLGTGSTISGTPTIGTTYTANADFSNALSSTISSAKVVYIGTDTAVAVSGLSASTLYSAAVFEYNTSGTCFSTSAASASGYTIAAKPTTFPASQVATTTSSTSISLSFSAASTITNAKGYLLLQKIGASAVSAVPVDGVSYTVGNTIGDATIASIISSTSTTSLLISGLTANTQYQFTLVPYNSDASATAATFSYTTVGGRTSASAFAASAGISYTISGPICSNIGTQSTAISVTTTAGITLNSGNNYILELSDAAGSFTSATTLATVASTAASVVTSVNVPTTSVSGTGYMIRVRTSNPVIASSSGSAFEIVATPQIVSSYSITGANASASASWTNPSSCLSGVIVIAKATSSVIGTPTGDGSTYTAVADFTGAGTTFGGGKVVYKGTGSSVTVTGLTNGTTYYLKIFTYTGFSWSAGQELTVIPANGAAAPTGGDIIFTQVEHQLTGTDLLISEYIEDGNQKYIEVYNPTNATITASNYGLRLFSNGSPSATYTAALTGTIPANSTQILRGLNATTNPNSQSTIYSTAVNFNGDDAIGIFTTAGGQIDLFGNIGCDPGTEWTSGTINTSTVTLRRVPASIIRVTTDPTNTSCPFPTLGTDWEELVSTNYTGLGYHKMEVANRTLVEFLTLKQMNLNGFNITDQGLCSQGKFLTKAGDNTYTFPSSGLETIPEGTFVRIKWNMAGTNDLDATDGIITLYANITETTMNNSVGDQLIAYTGVAQNLTTCGTGTSTDIKIAGFNFGENDWKTTNATIVNQDDSYAPNTLTDFSISGLKNFTDWRFSGTVSGTATSIAANSGSGIRVAANWTYNNTGTNRAILKNIKFNTLAYSSGSATVSNRSQTSFKLDWSNSTFTNSTANTRYLVVLNQGSAPSSPVDRYTIYTNATGNFSNAATIVTALTGSPDSLLSQLSTTSGSGKVVYMGAATNVAITGLTEKTSYSYSVFAFNGNGYTAAFSAANASLQGTVLTTTAEIAATYNSNSISNAGSISIGSTVSGTTIDFQVAISNTGEAPLSVSAGTLSNTNFILLSNPVQTINAGATKIYSLQYIPTSIGSETCTLSLANSDLTDATFRIIISASATGSSGSMISVLSTGYSSNIPYINFQTASVTNTANSVQLLNLNFQDGNGIINDIDNQATKIASIQFVLSDLDAIRSAALFDGNTLLSNTFVKNAATNSISFSSLQAVPVNITDNGSRSLQLRISFSELVFDNQQITVSLGTITTDAAGSALAANATLGLSSPISSNINRIQVTADRLTISSVNQVAEPCQVKLSLAISATDALQNTDSDVDNAQVAMSFGTTAQSNVASQVITISKGTASLTDALVYRNFTGTFSANSGIISGGQSITVSNVNCLGTILYKRTRQDGDWSGGSVWESVINNGGLITSNSGFYGSSPNNDSVEVIIAHNVSINTAINAGKLTVQKNKSLTIGGNFSVSGNVLVDSNAIMTLSSPLLLANGNQSITVNSGGTLVINHPYTSRNISTSLWKGTENFKAGSKIIVNQYPANETLSTGISPQNISGTTRYFDNLVVIGSFSNLVLGDSATAIARTLTVNTSGDTVHLSKNGIVYNLDSLTIQSGHLQISGGNSTSSPFIKYLTVGDGTQSATFQTSNYSPSLSRSKQTFTTQYLAINNNANYTHYGKTQLINTGTLSIGNGVNKLNLEIVGHTTAASNLPLTADDSLNVLAQARLDMNLRTSTGLGYFSVNDNAIITTANTLGFGNTSGTTGAVQIPNRVLSSNATYGFSGNTIQSTGLGMPATVKSLEINKSGGKVYLSKNTTATSNLSLLSGKLYANDYTVTVGTAGTNGSLEQGTDTTQSYLALSPKGLLKVYTNSSSNLISFPVGDSVSYSPLRIKFNQSTLASEAYVTAQVIDSIMPYIRNQGTLGQNYLSRYWKIEPTGISAFNYSASISVPVSEVIGSYSTLKLCKWNATNGFSKSTNNVTTTAGADNYINLGWNSISSFSTFSAAGEELLPITLLSINASLYNGNALIYWATLTEVQNRHFVVEKSYDGIKFDSIGIVAGIGNSNRYKSYSFTDNRFSSNAYYRLKQVDFNGGYSYSPTVYLVNTDKSEPWKVYPNPFSTGINLARNTLPSQLEVKVINAIGAVEARFSGSTTIVQDALINGSLQNLRPGMYLLQIFVENEPIKIQKIIKQ